MFMNTNAVGPLLEVEDCATGGVDVTVAMDRFELWHFHVGDALLLGQEGRIVVFRGEGAVMTCRHLLRGVREDMSKGDMADEREAKSQ